MARFIGLFYGSRRLFDQIPRHYGRGKPAFFYYPPSGLDWRSLGCLTPCASRLTFSARFYNLADHQGANWTFQDKRLIMAREAAAGRIGRTGFGSCINLVGIAGTPGAVISVNPEVIFGGALEC